MIYSTAQWLQSIFYIELNNMLFATLYGSGISTVYCDSIPSYITLLLDLL